MLAANGDHPESENKSLFKACGPLSSMQVCTGTGAHLKTAYKNKAYGLFWDQKSLVLQPSRYIRP